MNLLVVGASGRVGRLVVEQALGHGHEVTVLSDASQAPALASRERLRVVPATPVGPASLGPALEGAEAVIFALSCRGDGSSAAWPDAVADLVRAMTARGIDRLVAASAIGAGGETAGLALAYRAHLALTGGGRDLEALGAVEGDVMLSDLDWTLVRAARLTDAAQTGHYRVVEGPAVPKGTHIARADFAALLLKVAELGLYRCRVVAAAY